MHSAFLRVRGTKMSKRFGNITTARDLRQDGVDPGALRLLVYQTHYRQELDLTDDALAAAREGSRRLGEFARRLEGAAGADDDAGFTVAADRLQRDFTEALDDDLNAPRAVAAVFDFVSEGNRILDHGGRPGPNSLQVWMRTDRVLDATTRPEVQELRLGGISAAEGDGTLANSPPPEPEAQRAWAHGWALQRLDAKRRRDFPEADRIRTLLLEQGWEVRDKRDGTVEVSRK
jgi:cysteinyl-tRNA synthetase